MVYPNTYSNGIYLICNYMLSAGAAGSQSDAAGTKSVVQN